jgi:hypothetical protein
MVRAVFRRAISVFLAYPSGRTYAQRMMTTGFLLNLNDVLLGPPELATKNVFPDFDFLAGFISGVVTTSIPFLNVAFMCFSLSKSISHLQAATPIRDTCKSNVSAISGLAQRFKPFLQRASAEANATQGKANHWDPSPGSRNHVVQTSWGNIQEASRLRHGQEAIIICDALGFC